MDVYDFEDCITTPSAQKWYILFNTFSFGSESRLGIRMALESSQINQFLLPVLGMMMPQMLFVVMNLVHVALMMMHVARTH